MRTVARSLVIAAALSGVVQAAELADYRDDYQGPTPATGWSYLWNAPVDFGLITMDATTNPLGTSANYVPLQWNGSYWTADGDGDPNNSSPDNYLRLTSTGGHPGRGSGDASGVGNTQDRAPIAAYTIQPGQAGPVYLTNSFLDSASGTHTVPQTLRALVYVNDVLKTQAVQTGLPGNPVTFDAALGNLNVGDTVYVAMSPDTKDGSDTFAWDFTLSTIANSTNGPIVVADLVDDYVVPAGGNTGTAASFANLGNGWSYMWNAPADWNLANSPTASSDASTGGITAIADFEPLISSGSRWSPDGNNVNTDNSPARFMGSGGISGGLVSGHPGAGFLQTEGIGNDEDRYVIYAYTIDTDGTYAIIDSAFSTAGDQGDGNNIRIFTSLDAINALFNTTFDGVVDAKFDTLVGKLSAGDVIYVAVGVGSSGNDGSDNYAIDFSIAAVPTPAALPAGLVMLGLLGVRRRPGCAA